MALTNEQEKQLEELFKVKLKEQYNHGLHVGILSVSKVVLDKLNDNSKPLMKRIEDVKRFCKTPLSKQKQVERVLNEETQKVQISEAVESVDSSDQSNDENVVKYFDIAKERIYKAKTPSIIEGLQC